jgi:hypothetical protein
MQTKLPKSHCIPKESFIQVLTVLDDFNDQIRIGMKYYKNIIIL